MTRHPVMSYHIISIIRSGYCMGFIFFQSRGRPFLFARRVVDPGKANSQQHTIILRAQFTAHETDVAAHSHSGIIYEALSTQ